MSTNLTRFKLFVFCLSFLTLIMVTAETTFAQSNGKIAGRVTDAKTGDYLPGANILLEGTTFGTSSDRAGEYCVKNIPAGDYTLKVIYIGYKEFSAPLTITDGGTTGLDAALEAAFIQADEIVVDGLRQGQSKALSMQKFSKNMPGDWHYNRK